MDQSIRLRGLWDTTKTGRAWQKPINRKTHEIGNLLWRKVAHVLPLSRPWKSESPPADPPDFANGEAFGT